jgi:hypothetical protein
MGLRAFFARSVLVAFCVMGVWAPAGAMAAARTQPPGLDTQDITWFYKDPSPGRALRARLILDSGVVPAEPWGATIRLRHGSRMAIALTLFS